MMHGTTNIKNCLELNLHNHFSTGHFNKRAMVLIRIIKLRRARLYILREEKYAQNFLAETVETNWTILTSSLNDDI